MKTRILIILLIFICSIYSFTDNNILLSNMNNEEHWIYQYIIDDIKVYKMNNIKYKRFYGMSSSTAMEKHSGGVSNYKSSEEKKILIPAINFCKLLSN